MVELGGCVYKGEKFYFTCSATFQRTSARLLNNECNRSSWTGGLYQGRSANVNIPFHDTNEQHFIIRVVHFCIIYVIIFLSFDTPALCH
jgi:hypothetical protein